MFDALMAAFALMLVVEGLLPFVSPSTWRHAVEFVARLSDRHVRMIGLASMVSGLLLLSVVLR